MFQHKVKMKAKCQVKMKSTFAIAPEPYSIPSSAVTESVNIVPSLKGWIAEPMIKEYDDLLYHGSKCAFSMM
jgi:hypothetical protein